MENKCYQPYYPKEDKKPQRHDHELLGNVRVAGRDPHVHHFSTVSGEAILIGDYDHVHEVEFRTDFYEDHYHTFRGKSGGAIKVGGGRHVHFAQAETSFDDGHRHDFKLAALIEDPTGK